MIRLYSRGLYIIIIAPRIPYVHNRGITIAGYPPLGALRASPSAQFQQRDALFFCEIWLPFSPDIHTYRQRGPVVQLGGLVPARPIMMMMTIKVIPKIIPQSITTIQENGDKSRDIGTLIQGNHYSGLASMYSCYFYGRHLQFILYMRCDYNTIIMH